MLKNKMNLKELGTYGIVFFIMLFSFFFYYKYVQTDMTLLGITNSSQYIKGYILLGLSTLLIAMIATFFVKTKDTEKLPKYYFIIAMLLGTCYLFLMPLFAQSDEPSHYLRAYEISNGSLVTPYINNEKGNLFDKTIEDSIYMNTTNDKLREYKTYEDMQELSKIKTNHEEKVFMKTTASNYSFFNYIPHIIGFWIGKVLQLNPYFCGILGRFLSLLFCVGLATIGLKLLPKGKFFAFTFLLTPTFLSYSASFSADGSTIAYCFLFASLLLNKMKKKKILNWKDHCLLSLLIICTSLAKIVYLPFVVLIFFLPKECFKNRKQEVFYKIGYVLLGIVVNLGWQGIFRMVPKEVILEESTGGGVNSWILKQPIRYIMVILNTIFTNGYNYLENMFAGEFLCHWQVRPFAIVNFGFIIINIIAYLSEEKNKKLSFIQKGILVGIIGIVFVLVCTAMYQDSTYESAPIINGIQGRYFTPLLCILLFFQVKNTLKINKNYLTYCTIILNYLVLLETIHTFLYWL